MKFIKLFEDFDSGVKKGTISVSGKVITIAGVGKIDYTNLSFNTDIEMMQEVLSITKNWDKDFIKTSIGNFQGQFLFNYDDRLFVFVKIGRWVMPFYFSSSGTSGKKIDWHYVFGVDTKNDWIIKGGVLPSGEMSYKEYFTKTYQNEINKIESMKLELRNKLPLTTLERDELVDYLSMNRSKYPKTLESIFIGLDVVKEWASDGVVSNDNYDYLLNCHLSILKHQS